MNIETRLTNLENLVHALVNTLNLKDLYNNADKAGIRQTENFHEIGISENDTAICDVADLSDVNSQAIDDLAEMVDELANQIAEKEG